MLTSTLGSENIMKKTLQILGVVLLLTPFAALTTRYPGIWNHSEGLRPGLSLLFQSRMVFVFGWIPFAIGITMICIGSFALKSKTKAGPQPSNSV